MITARDVAFRYPGPDGFALDLPALDVGSGEHVACVGRSGIGKTTLVHLLTGVLEPRSGSIICDDFDVTRASDAARRAWRLRRVGLVFQELELVPYLTGLENVLLPTLLGAADAGASGRARELAEALGVTHTLERKPARLSRGERQRLAICRALVMDPPIVIADEPTGSLDSASAAFALAALLGEARESGRTLLMVTHDDAVLDRFDRVVDLGADP